MRLQGAGTAIGELPPYFMARASRLSGEVDEEEQEIENLLQENQEHPSELVFRCSLFLGFWGELGVSVVFSHDELRPLVSNSI